MIFNTLNKITSYIIKFIIYTFILTALILIIGYNQQESPTLSIFSILSHLYQLNY